ncbi:MAG: hypothetical protein R2729_29660 [Bryobacteraceae bacterium]
MVHENWSSSASGIGKSYNFYDKSKSKWRQVWVDDNARVLDFTGELRDGAMRFQGESVSREGKPVWNRMTFTPEAEGTVRQKIEQSLDGKTYTTAFEGIYRRK